MKASKALADAAYPSRQRRQLGRKCRQQRLSKGNTSAAQSSFTTAEEPTKAIPAHKLFPLDAEVWAETLRTLALAPRQAEIVRLLLCGMRDKQVAAAMGLKVPTVRTYLKRIFDRLKVGDRVELILHVTRVAQTVCMRYRGRQS